jgi:Uma2 family endonuclease
MVRTVADREIRGEQRLRMSYEEYQEYVDDSTHSEWVDGEVTIFMPPTLMHQLISQFLTLLISRYARVLGLGQLVYAPFEMKLRDGRSYREPDLLFVRAGERARLTNQRLTGPADLVIELLSDESVARDRDEKFREYEAAGVREYWLIDPRLEPPTVKMFALETDGRYAGIPADERGRLHSRVLAGLWIDPAWFASYPFPDELTLLHEMAPSRFPAFPPV